MFKKILSAAALLAVASARLNAVNDDCTYSDQDTCDADSSCTWCKSAAVPSQCYTESDAQSLPSSIFACDNLELADADDCTGYGDQDTCDADDACAWCRSAAVPSSCLDRESAEALPASVFDCDL